MVGRMLCIIFIVLLFENILGIAASIGIQGGNVADIDWKVEGALGSSLSRLQYFDAEKARS